MAMLIGKKFYRRLSKYMFDELIFSKYLKERDQEEAYRGICAYIKKMGYYPGEICWIINIYRMLIYDYQKVVKLETLKLAEKIYLKKGDKLEKYKSKIFNKLWGGRTYKNPISLKEAFDEQVSRGFIPLEKNKMRNNRAYIRSNCCLIYYPKSLSKEKAYHSLVGVSGWTGIEFTKS